MDVDVCGRDPACVTKLIQDQLSGVKRCLLSSPERQTKVNALVDCLLFLPLKCVRVKEAGLGLSLIRDIKVNSCLLHQEHRAY